MHYKDGSPARIGDVIKGKHPNAGEQNRQIVGVVQGTFTSDKCNLTVKPVAEVIESDGARVVSAGEPYTLTCTAGEFERVL